MTKKIKIRKLSPKQNTLPKTQNTTPKTIEVHYIKTPSYRSYHTDGVFGGITPNGKLYIEFFIQRQVTPQLIEYEVTAEGKLGSELKKTGKKGFIREIEAGLVMDIEVAKIMRKWLDDKIATAEKLFSPNQEDANNGK